VVGHAKACHHGCTLSSGTNMRNTLCVHVSALPLVVKCYERSFSRLSCSRSCCKGFVLLFVTSSSLLQHTSQL
jgi:hypothetical protein